MKKQKIVIKHYSMPESIARLIEYMAGEFSMNKSELIREAVRFYARHMGVKKYDK